MPAERKAPQIEEAARRIEKAKLSGASDLDLWCLDLTAIPDHLDELANLRILSLTGNQITTIPDSFAELVKLEILHLSDNQITAIPDSFAKLARLSSLSLSGNQIPAIPDSLPRLSRLRTLYLGGNQIRVVPGSLARLTELSILDLTDNFITAIPETLSTLKNLTGVFLHGNPELGIPPEVLGPPFGEIYGGEEKLLKPPKEILAYYFAQRSGATPLNEAKLILVGRGFVGKTSLVKALMTGQFTQGEEPTEGIKISDWRCPLNQI